MTMTVIVLDSHGITGHYVTDFFHHYFSELTSVSFCVTALSDVRLFDYTNCSSHFSVTVFFLN